MLRQQAADRLLNGSSRFELEVGLMRMFHEADMDGSGKVSPQEFHRLLFELNFNAGDDCAGAGGLSFSEVNCLMYDLDKDGDGLISVDEFVPVAVSYPLPNLII